MQVNENLSFGGESLSDASANQDDRNWVYMKKPLKIENVHKDRKKKKEELEQLIKQAELKLKEKRREIERLRK